LFFDQIENAMTKLLTAAQMRAIEQAAIESGDVTGLELMERAGRSVVEAILEEWPSMALTSHKAVVLCGPGNNGGDGFVVARLLKERGWEVEVFLYGDEGKLPVDAKTNCLRWRELGEVRELSASEVSNTDADLWIDAVFGTGLTRGIPEEVFWSFSAINEKLTENGQHSCAIDVPSGICADSGRVLNQAHLMDVGLCIGISPTKIGLLTGQAPYISKRVSSVDIGLNTDPISVVNLINRVDRQGTATSVDKYDGNKYSHGHALILSGPSGKTGAARLAARGALRMGAGVVTVACPPDALAENAAQLNAIMINPVADATALQAVLQDERINALCLGPALGLGQDQAALLVEALTVRGDRTPYGTRKIVLDADALTLLSNDDELFGMLHENCVLTPHGGEFARLFPDIAAKLAEPATKGPAYSKVDATREAAKRAGCVVLYKGADTVIADPSGRAAINSAHYERAAPWLATAGAGDVLAGFVTGLMARGFGPMQAAETGAWLHVECALKFGPGLIAEDIAEQLPKVFTDLGL
jgi:hydroxyethylthiazole kinase-like uncharacterized protein yjeF